MCSLLVLQHFDQCVLQGLVASMQSSPSLSQQQMSQIISAGSFSHKQAQLQPNTIPLSHGKVRLATICYACHVHKFLLFSAYCERACHEACCFSLGCKECVGCPQARLPEHLLLWETKPEGLPAVYMYTQVELHSRALLAMGAGDIVVPVFDEEPTSIIAYALSSRQAFIGICCTRSFICCIASCLWAMAQLVGPTSFLLSIKASDEVLQCCIPIL